MAVRPYGGGRSLSGWLGWLGATAGQSTGKPDAKFRAACRWGGGEQSSRIA